jgi:hypothetical protein
MPNYSLKARVLRIKQTNGLDFSTALPTSPSPLPILPPRPFFMKFRGPQALSNRPPKTMVCDTVTMLSVCVRQIAFVYLRQSKVFVIEKSHD